jgi:hypothetical protein
LLHQPGESTYNVGLLPLVFGTYSGEVGMASRVDISGLYNTSRTIFSGFAKPYSLFTLMPVEPSEAGGYVLPGAAITVMPAGDGAFLLDQNGMKQFLCLPIPLQRDAPSFSSPAWTISRPMVSG